MPRAPRDDFPFTAQTRINERHRRALKLLTAEAGVTTSEYLRQLLDEHILSRSKRWRDQLDLPQAEFVEIVADFLAEHEIRGPGRSKRS